MAGDTGKETPPNSMLRANHGFDDNRSLARSKDGLANVKLCKLEQISNWTKWKLATRMAANIIRILVDWVVNVKELSYDTVGVSVGATKSEREIDRHTRTYHSSSRVNENCCWGPRERD